jgi:putative oxidoreductase
MNRPHIGLLVLRIAMGIVFLSHGWMKLFGEQISFVQEMLNMAGASLPGSVLWLIAVAETIAGLALLLGIFTRHAALLLAVEMIVAVLLFHAREGFFIVAIANVPLAYGFEFHLALIGGLVCLGLSGPGALSLENRVRRATGSTES